MEKYLTYGALGIVLALAVLTFRLLNKEQEKNPPRKSILKAIYTFMAFAVLVMVLGIIAEFLKNPENVKTILGNKERQIVIHDDLPKRELKSINASEFFINSEQGYFLQKPENKFTVNHANNYDEYLDLTGLKVNRTIREYMAKALEQSPFGEMMKNVKVDELVFGNKHEFGIYTPSTNPLDLVLDKIDDMTKSEDSTTMITGEDVDSYNYTKFEFKNKISIAAYDKSNYKGQDFTLEKFFFAQSIFLLSDKTISIDDLKTTKTSIALYYSVNVDKGLVDQKKMELRIDRWMLFYETETKIFIIETSFSPQTKEAINLWTSMKKTSESFGVIEQ